MNKKQSTTTCFDIISKKAEKLSNLKLEYDFENSGYTNNYKTYRITYIDINQEGKYDIQ